MMLAKLFEDIMRSSQLISQQLTSQQIEQIELLEVNLLVLDYQFFNDLDIIFFEKDNKKQFYVFYSHFDNNWNIVNVSVKADEMIYKQLFSMDKLLNKILKLILTGEEKYDVNKTI